MGVPDFFRCLTEKYPLVIADVVEETAAEIAGVTNAAEPNPNGLEFDNLYLVMNDIVHQCFRPEDRPAPTSFDEVFHCMFDYIDRLFIMVQPRKVLYIAIDGVAPRAKMNQQRSRQFMAAKDAAEAAAEEERLRQEFESEGRKLPPKLDCKLCDTNDITPGTEFMSVLSSALQYYIHRRLTYDLGWRQIKVILSDANVPGEAKHKVMSYIRLQRNLPGYDPNTRHCLYGLDADLIMFALATHEVQFSILRKVVFTPGHQDKYFLCGRMDHSAVDCQGNAKRKVGEFDEKSEDVTPAKKTYQFLHIWILREYLHYEFGIPNPPFDIDFERIVDDFIFICFFVGNDFLPHMPTFEIHEGAINLLIAVYKKEFRAMGGYLTDSCTLNLSRVEHFIQAICSNEGMIFQKRASLHQQAESIKCEKAQAKLGDDVDPQLRPDDIVTVAHHKGSDVSTSMSGLEIKATQSRDSDVIVRAAKVQHISSEGASVCVAIVEAENCLEEIHKNEEDLKSRLKELFKEKSDIFNSDNPEEDKVKLGEEGWKKRYYEQKFDAKTPEEIEAIRRDVVLRYTEGLCWIMRYYYEGVSSWKWFYPYHYAPFASDLKGLGQLNISFELGSPFKPFNQLMGVFPAASAHALPFHYRQLMLDPNSPIIDFYPTDFEVDMNGKRYAWQGIAKLPFIDEGRLLDEIGKVEHTLTEEEVRRNSVMFDTLFINLCHPLSPYIFSLNQRFGRVPENDRANVKEKVDPVASSGMNGYLSLNNGDPCPPVFRSPIKGMDDIMDNQVICAIYKVPDAHKHIAQPPAGVVLPKKTVSASDLKPPPVLWHEDTRCRVMDNGRPKLHGSILGQLGEAAHRLVKNSLQMQTECDGGERRHAANVAGNPNGQANGHLDNGHASSASSNPGSQQNYNYNVRRVIPRKRSQYERNQQNIPERGSQENNYNVRRVVPSSSGHHLVRKTNLPYGLRRVSVSNHSAPAGRGCGNNQPTDNGYSALNGAPAGRGNGNNQPTDNGYSALNGGAASNHSASVGSGYSNNQRTENGHLELNGGAALDHSPPAGRGNGDNQPTENGYSALNGGSCQSRRRAASNHSASASRGYGNNQPTENGYSALNGGGGQSRRKAAFYRLGSAVRGYVDNQPKENGYSALNGGAVSNHSASVGRGYSNNQATENGHSELNGGAALDHSELNGGAALDHSAPAGRGNGDNQPTENGYSTLNGRSCPSRRRAASNHSASASRGYGNNQPRENGYSALNRGGGQNRRKAAFYRLGSAVRGYVNNQPEENDHSPLNGRGAASNPSAPAGRRRGNNQPTENGYSALNGEGGQSQREGTSGQSSPAGRGYDNNQPTENGH